jgi:PAS domain S-box-containing protein
VKRAPGDRLWTLGAWLAFASSLLTVLLTLLLTLVIERTASAGVASRIGVNLAELASQTANGLDRGRFERQREIQLMAARLARMKDWGEMQAELDAARSSYRFYAWLGATDSRGVLRAASGNAGEAKLRPAGDGEPQRFFDVAFPLPGRADGGVLVAHVSWDWAQDVRQAIFGPVLRGGVDPLIVGADGVVLIGPADVERRKLDLASLQKAAAGERGHAIEQWQDGETYLVGFASTQGYLSSPGPGWRVLVRQQLDVAYQPLRRVQARVLAWGATLAVLFSLAGWLAARAVTRPLLNLAGAARRMAQGEDAAVQPSHAYREVEMLGSAFNAMLANLGRQAEELRKLNAELEQRVDLRTAELREAFERVRSSEQRIQAIIESAQDPFIGIDLQGRITDWSTQAEVMFGWGREEAIGRPAASLLLPERFAGSLEVALAEYARTGRSGILNRPIERVMVDRRGREIPVEIRFALVSTGHERFLTAFVHDISQRKEVERLKDEFISTVSHELRTPLTAIYGSLSLLTSGTAGELPADARQLLAISHQSTERLMRMVDDMLDLEKIATGEIEYDQRPQRLRPLVEQAIRDTRAHADTLRVRIALQATADPVADVDADRIVQVCVNLLSNAAKFSPAGAAVEVSLETRDGRARVGVVDRGAGVPPAFQEHMFERFAQADASDARTQGGTGLSLSICRSIVEAHGGRLGFTSEPGVRTEFFFELPATGA